jgi:ribosomal protein S18 acetylase RimI-like enzyme
MDILVATENDIAELATVEIESKQQSIPELLEDFEVDYAAREHRWRTYFRGESPQTSKPQRQVFKAVINEKIIGYIAGHLTTRYGKDAEIQSFYVLKEFQRKGIGTTLLAKFVNWFNTLEAQSLCVGIKADNPYKAFYLKHGGQYLNEHWVYWDNCLKLDS